MFRAPRFALALVLIASASTARAADVDPLMPKEAEQIIYVNFKQILDSEMIKKYTIPKVKETIKKSGEAEAIFESLGLDPFKDVETLTVAIWGEGPTETQIVAIVRGVFDPEKLNKAADDFATKYPDKVAVVTEEGLRLVKVGPKERPFYVHVVDEKSIFAASTPKQVAEALEAKKTKAKAKLSRELTALVLKQDAKASMYFCQLVFDRLGKLPDFQVPGLDGALLKEQIATINSFSATLRIGKEFNVEVVAGMKNGDAAEAFGSTVDKLLGLLRTFLPIVSLQQPDKKPFFDEFAKSVKHTVKRSDVIVSMKLSAEAFGSLFGPVDE